LFSLQPLMFQNGVYANKRVHSNGTLSITNVTQQDQGYYICKAFNPLMASSDISIEQNIWLDVRTHSNEMPPIIMTAPFNHTIRPGGTIRLECEASSDETVTISWRYINEAVRATNNWGSRINIAENGTLTVSDAKYEDSGLYKCQARAGDGMTERSAIVTIKQDGLVVSPSTMRLPRPVDKPVVFRVTQDSVSLRWETAGNVSPQYTVEMYSFEQHVFAWTTVAHHVYDTSITIGRLTPGADYVFVVRGVNEIGVGLPSPVSDIVRTIAPVTSALTGLRERDIQMQMNLVEVDALAGVSLNATSAWLSWNVARNAGHVLGFLLKYTMHDSSDNFLSATYTQIKVSDPSARAILVTGLEPWSSYVAKVEPYYDSVHGAESNEVFFSTPQGVPRYPPSYVQLHRVKANQYTVTWNRPVKANEGHVIGYSVLVKLSDSPEKSTNHTTSASVFKQDVTLAHAGDKFTVSVAAMTKAGVGVYSSSLGPEHVSRPGSMTWMSHMPWILGVVGAVVWISLGILIIILCRRSRRSHYKTVRAVKYERNQPMQEYGQNMGQWQVIMPAASQSQSQQVPTHHMMQFTPPNSTGGGPVPMTGDQLPVYISNTASVFSRGRDPSQQLIVDLECCKGGESESTYQCAGDCCEEGDNYNHMGCACKHFKQRHRHSSSGTPIMYCAPNRYHATLPHPIPNEPLYNELDPRNYSGEGTSPESQAEQTFRQHTPHHYEIYDSEMGADVFFQSNEPLLSNTAHPSFGHAMPQYPGGHESRIHSQSGTPRSSCPKMGMSMVRNSMQTPVNLAH
jgi:hypothetical protein